MAVADADDAKRVRLMLVGDDPDSLGGIATHLQLIRTHIAPWAPLSIYAVGPAGRAENALARTARRVGEPFRFYLALRRRRPSIVHLNCSFDVKSLARDAVLASIASAMGIAVLLQIHSGLTREALARSRSCRLLTHLALRAAKRAVFLTQLQLDPVAERFEAYSPKLMVVPNMAPSLTDGGKLVATPKASPPGLLFLSRILREKGIFDLLEAAQLLVQRGLAFELTIAGDGPDGALAREWAKSLDIAGMVRFVGYVSGAEKSRALYSATALVLPTYYQHEGAPYSLLEAMQAGLPIVTCRTGGIAEILNDESAVFVPPRNPTALADALERVLVDAGLRRRLGAAAARQARGRFGPDVIIERWKQIYLQLVK